MQGSFFYINQEEYTPVQAKIATRQNEGASSGYQEGNFRIDWTTQNYDFTTHTGGGITGTNWYRNDPNSPFYEKTDDEMDKIVEEANNTGNMNNVFSEWGNRTGIDRNHFIKVTINNLCWTIL